MSSKHQITIPVEALREAGVEAGDRLAIRADGPGRLVIERADDTDPVAALAGIFEGMYPPEHLDELRGEWER